MVGGGSGDAPGAPLPCRPATHQQCLASLPSSALPAKPFASTGTCSQHAWLASTPTFFWNWTLTKCGCAPSDCQYVSSLPSRSSSTPLPGLALVTLHTASRPISRLLVSGWRAATTAGRGAGGSSGWRQVGGRRAALAAGTVLTGATHGALPFIVIFSNRRAAWQAWWPCAALLGGGDRKVPCCGTDQGVTERRICPGCWSKHTSRPQTRHEHALQCRRQRGAASPRRLSMMKLG